MKAVFKIALISVFLIGGCSEYAPNPVNLSGSLRNNNALMEENSSKLNVINMGSGSQQTQSHLPPYITYVTYKNTHNEWFCRYDCTF